MSHIIDSVVRGLELLTNVSNDKLQVLLTALALVTLLVAIWRLAPRAGAVGQTGSRVKRTGRKEKV